MTWGESEQLDQALRLAEPPLGVVYAPRSYPDAKLAQELNTERIAGVRQGTLPRRRR